LTVFKNNRTAFMANLIMIAIGLLLIGLSTLAFQGGLSGPITWMVLLGGGLYLAYTPFNGLLFDRFFAASRMAGTAGFLIYVADASGYLGSTALLLFKNFSGLVLPWSQFLAAAAYGTAAIGLGLLLLTIVYFAKRLEK
jgi:hypothetical protein